MRIRFPLGGIKDLILYFPYTGYEVAAALSSTTHHTMPKEFGAKWRTEVSHWRTECLNIMFPDSLCVPCYVQGNQSKSRSSYYLLIMNNVILTTPLLRFHLR